MSEETDKKTANNGRNPNGTFAKGNKASPGRPEGSPNKFTTLKDAFINAFNRAGGEDGLVEYIEKNVRQRERFYQMITKMLPANVDLSGAIKLMYEVSDNYLPEIKPPESAEEKPEEESE